MKSLPAILIFFLGLALLQGQTRLQYNLQPGARYEVLQEGEQQLQQELPDGKHEIQNLMKGHMILEVMEASEEAYLLQARFIDLALKIESSREGLLLHVDTRDAEAERSEETELFQEILNVPFLVKMAKNGNILSVSGGDALIDRLLESAEPEDPFTEALMRNTLEKDFGSEALIEGFRQLTFFYPDHKVSVGDHWTNSYHGKIQSENSWTLSSLDNRAAIITGSSTIRMSLPSEDAGEPAWLQGKQETRIVAYRKSGFARELEIKSRASGKTVYNEEQIPTTITATTKFTLTHVQ